MQYNKWWKGISLSKNVQNGFDNIKGDVWSQIGSYVCPKKLTEDADIIDRPCYLAAVPTGEVYALSKTDGKIWRRQKIGAWEFLRTGTHGGYKGAKYYRGSLYYSMDAFLGKCDLANTWNDNFQTLTAGVPHAVSQFDLILYVTNSNNIAQLDDADVWTASALDLPTEHRSTSLMPFGDDLLTLSNPGDYINDSAIFRWNTYSDSWTIKDNIKEIDAYAFLDADNNVYVICSSGNIYYYNGAKLEPFSIIRDPYDTSGHQLTTNFQGKPLVANGGRIYSLYRKTRDLDVALVWEFTCSAGEDATIHSIEASGDNLFVSWEKNGSYGIDNLTLNYDTGIIITPRFTRDNVVRVFYETLNGGSIAISSKKDGDSNWSAHTVYDDSSDKRMVRNVDDIMPTSGAQAKITITPNPDDTTLSPIITDIRTDRL